MTERRMVLAGVVGFVIFSAALIAFTVVTVMVIPTTPSAKGAVLWVASAIGWGALTVALIVWVVKRITQTP